MSFKTKACDPYIVDIFMDLFRKENDECSLPA